MLRPDGALLALFGTVQPHETPRYTKYIVVDESNLMYRPHPAARGRQAILLNRDIIRLFDGLRVADSFLLQNNVREILFRKPASILAGRCPQRPVIALLTDFGLADHYVGVDERGHRRHLCPDALTIDITHDVPPQDLMAAAFALAASWRYFPPGTVFVVVVDPGVGTRRRAIAAASASGSSWDRTTGYSICVVAEQPVVARRWN